MRVVYRLNLIDNSGIRSLYPPLSTRHATRPWSFLRNELIRYTHSDSRARRVENRPARG